MNDTKVLVIDDDEKAGRAFGRLIEASTGLVTAFTSDPDEALDIVRRNQVGVAVIDQKMPGTAGTTLFARIRDINPHIRGIMFSGQAEMEDLAEAVELRYCKVLDKSRLAELPDIVWTNYAEVLADSGARNTSNARIIGRYRSGFSVRGERVQFRLLAEEDLREESEVISKNYKTFLRLIAGESRRTSFTFEHESEVVIEDEMQDNVSLTAAIKVQLFSELKTAVQEAYRAKLQQRSKEVRQLIVERSLILSDDASYQGQNIYVREFQAAAVYRRRRYTVEVSCSCCGTNQVFPLVLLVPTGEHETRQVDHLGDNAKHIVDTGRMSVTW
jgi:CheY-like chemotaxis protein